MMRIFYIDWQQHWKYDRTMNIGANAHGKRAVSTLKTATSDRLDLRWQLGLQWHRIGIELVLQVPRLFHSAGATLLQCIYYLCCISLGRRGYFGVSNVGLVIVCRNKLLHSWVVGDLRRHDVRVTSLWWIVADGLFSSHPSHEVVFGHAHLELV